MKKIKLPISNSYIASFNLKNLQIGKEIILPNGQKVVTLGQVQMGTEEQKKQLEQARENGGQVIWATSAIERQLENLITKYLFTIDIGLFKERSFFITEIMESSELSYKFKKTLVLKLIHIEKLLSGKERNILEKNLTTVMRYRNSFANGELMIDNKNDVFLTYYSGDKKNDILNDDYWEKLESVFKETNELLNKAERMLIENKMQELKESK